MKNLELSTVAKYNAADYKADIITGLFEIFNIRNEQFIGTIDRTKLTEIEENDSDKSLIYVSVTGKLILDKRIKVFVT